MTVLSIQYLIIIATQTEVLRSVREWSSCIISHAGVAETQRPSVIPRGVVRPPPYVSFAHTQTRNQERTQTRKGKVVSHYRERPYPRN